MESNKTSETSNVSQKNTDKNRKGLWPAVVLLLLNVLTPNIAFAREVDHLQEKENKLEISQFWVKTIENLRVKKAENVIKSQSERSPLTVQNKEELIEYYTEKYMPKEGCSLIEDLPPDSDIHYVELKPEPPKPNKKEIPSKPKKQKKSAAPKTTEYKGKAISMTEEEREWLEKLVEAEAGGEPYLGKLAVATVIANRVESPSFPDSVMGVIKANNGKRHQFQPWDDGRIYEVTPSEETKKAIKEVFDDGVRVLPEDVVYFAVVEVAFEDWMGKTREHIVNIGNHAFFSENAKT